MHVLLTTDPFHHLINIECADFNIFIWESMQFRETEVTRIVGQHHFV